MQFTQARRRRISHALILLVGIVTVLHGESAFAQVSTGSDFLSFIRGQAKQLRAGTGIPATLPEWNQRRAELRQQLQDALGRLPEASGIPAVRLMGVLERDTYRVEKLLLETLPGIWMTCNAWVPRKAGRVPAVLCVHGHWPGAKTDPHVQARCVGLAKLGFFVLSVDAFGAGERGIQTAPGEYHGEMTAATLVPSGKVLCGIQLYENMRAADYLQSRPEVDADRLGITGASGGGNQTMYAGAMDERIAAVVPVCSVGNYQAYLGAACCLCETVPGALRFTEEEELLGLVAPRGLMVISATRDAPQFSVAAAQVSVSGAASAFQLYEAGDSLRHQIIDSGHDYNREMREAMYGFMVRHLRGEGFGHPVSEPAQTLEAAADLHCFPDGQRPADWITLPQAAAELSRQAVVAAEQLTADERRQGLIEVLGLNQGETAGGVEVADSQEQSILFAPEPGILLQVSFGSRMVERVRKEKKISLRVVTDRAAVKSMADEAVLELRATGTGAWASDRIGGAVDHNTAEWSLWIGRPLAGQWTTDISSALSVLRQRYGDVEITLRAEGSAAVAVVMTAAFSAEIQAVEVSTLPFTWITDKPWKNHRIGTLVPGILQRVGDLPSVLKLIAPRPLTVDSWVTPQGTETSENTELTLRRKLSVSWGAESHLLQLP